MGQSPTRNVGSARTALTENGNLTPLITSDADTETPESDRELPDDVDFSALKSSRSQGFRYVPH